VNLGAISSLIVLLFGLENLIYNSNSRFPKSPKEKTKLKNKRVRGPRSFSNVSMHEFSLRIWKNIKLGNAKRRYTATKTPCQSIQLLELLRLITFLFRLLLLVQHLQGRVVEADASIRQRFLGHLGRRGCLCHGFHCIQSFPSYRSIG